MNNIELFANIDESFIKTLQKYNKEQLAGAIITYIVKNNPSSFSGDKSREIIKKIGPLNIKKALLLNILKLQANFGINNLRNIESFSKNYAKHSIGETELRLMETISLSTDPKFGKKAIQEADYIISNEPTALLNVIKSFIESRYIKKQKEKLEKPIYDLKYLDIIDNINKYYEGLNNLSV